MFERRAQKLAATIAATTLLTVAFAPKESAAAAKDECLEAHSRGQDLREKGQLTRARLAFLGCAQPVCPNLIQADCARFGEELERLLPSVSFVARDARGTDLPMTSVYVDDTLVATKLDDGKSYDIDPGKHVVRFVHDGDDTVLKVVVNQGEKGRALVATFAAGRGFSSVASTSPDARPPGPSRPVLPLIVAGVGGAALAAGGVLVAVGLHQVPQSCSVSTHDCVAAPGDPVFDQASSGVGMANAGIGVAISGAVVLAGGLVWYFVQPTKPSSDAASLPLARPVLGRGTPGSLAFTF